MSNHISLKDKITTKEKKINKTNKRKNGKKCIVCNKDLTGWSYKYCSDKCAREETNILNKIKKLEIYRGAKVIKIYEGQSPHRKSKKVGYRVIFIENKIKKDLSINVFRQRYIYKDLTY